MLPVRWAMENQRDLVRIIGCDEIDAGFLGEAVGQNDVLDEQVALIRKECQDRRFFG